MPAKTIVPSPRAAPYLATLRRVPDDIMLAVGSREFDMGANTRCLCGWVIRESLARCGTHGMDAADDRISDCLAAEASNTHALCCDRFGGSASEWLSIFTGVLHPQVHAIEEAFTLRVMEAAGVAKVA